MTPSDWEQRELHAWLTITVLHGKQEPTRLDERVLRLDACDRRTAMLSMLGLREGETREIPSVLGAQLKLDCGVIDKMLRDEKYLWRLPYAAWAAHGPVEAVEVWRILERSQKTGALELRDYYLVPFMEGASKHDGYVVIADRNGRIFNVFPFEASYADARLRRNGILLYKGYPDGTPCSTGCCQAFAGQRREQGKLRDENRRLQHELRDERLVRKAAERSAAEAVAEARRLQRALDGLKTTVSGIRAELLLDTNLMVAETPIINVKI